MNMSKRVILIATFASIVAISDSIPGIPQFESGVWYSWIFLMVPLVGLLLAPSDAFLSIFIGVLVGHYIYFRGPYEFLFALGSPIGACMTSLLFRGKFRFGILYFIVLLVAYFSTPLSHNLPLWGMWDVYVAFLVLLVLVWLKGHRIRLVASSFIGLEADILFRIFLFVPLQTYRIFYGFTLETMKVIWVAGAFMTPIQVSLALLFTTLIYPPIANFITKSKLDFFK